jgi:uncharacterized protein involved in response to NO
MKRTAETQRSWIGLALWSRGFWPFFLAAALWAVAAIAIGTMTLAMMTRATLGHTGRAAAASHARNSSISW